jgi:hypothetical protein
MVQHMDTPALHTATVLEAQWSDCPEDVYEEVVQMWQNFELGNDFSYVTWDAEFEEDYPIIAKYIADHNVTGECLIHFWW